MEEQMTNVENLIAAMLTENTGTHMLDSGGANGRAWQRNQVMTVEKFKSQPSAYVEITLRDWNGETFVDMTPCVDVFHLLTSGALELDGLCDEFNAMPVDDWHGDYYGVSVNGQEWLDRQGFEAKGDGFNTYNWFANHSQTLQGQELELDGDNYMLIQIHGGADVRGGYTDAKLFKLDYHAEYYNVLTEDCLFAVELKDKDSQTPDMFTGQTHDNHIYLDWRGEWINYDGSCATDEDLLAFATACGVTKDTSIVVYGDACLDF